MFKNIAVCDKWNSPLYLFPFLSNNNKAHNCHLKIKNERHTNSCIYT